MTPYQLRVTNLIFLEHEKWSKQIPLYKKQIESYKYLDSIYNKHDSIQIQHINYLNTIIDNDTNKIHKLKTTKNIGIGVIIALIIGLIWKQ